MNRAFTITLQLGPNNQNESENSLADHLKEFLVDCK